MCRPIRFARTEYAYDRTGNVRSEDLAVDGTAADQGLGSYFQYDGLGRLAPPQRPGESA